MARRVATAIENGNRTPGSPKSVIVWRMLNTVGIPSLVGPVMAVAKRSLIFPGAGQACERINPFRERPPGPVFLS